MKSLLLSAMLCLFAQSAFATNQVDQIIEKLTDEQKAAQLILVYYTTPEFIAEHEFGGVLITQNMLNNPEKLKSELKKTQAQSKTGIFVSIDQEGGRVNRMKLLQGFRTVPSAQKMSSWSKERIREYSAHMALALHDLGINLNLAPVLDPSLDYMSKKTFMAKKQRTFGHSVEQTATKAGAYIAGFQSQGIWSVSKHFPGYDVQTNSDHEIAISQASLKDVNKNIEPFQRLATEVIGVMMSSVQYTKLAEAPAVMSKKLVSLARQSHPDSILMTDDLWEVLCDPGYKKKEK